MALPPPRPLTQRQSAEVVVQRPATPSIRAAYPAPSDRFSRRDQRALSYESEIANFRNELEEATRRHKLAGTLQLWAECSQASMKLLEDFEAEVARGISDERQEELRERRREFKRLYKSALGMYDDGSY